MAPWITLLLEVLIGYARKDGKSELADLISDGVALARAGKNVDKEMQRIADEWIENGAPSHESIVEARRAIQVAIGD